MWCANARSLALIYRPMGIIAPTFHERSDRFKLVRDKQAIGGK